MVGVTVCPTKLRPAQLNVQVHSLLHTNLNTVDVSAAAAFYAELLQLRPGMKTARTAADGRALGVAGTPVTGVLVPLRPPRAAHRAGHRGARMGDPRPTVGATRPSRTTSASAPSATPCRPKPRQGTGRTARPALGWPT